MDDKKLGCGGAFSRYGSDFTNIALLQIEPCKLFPSCSSDDRDMGILDYSGLSKGLYGSPLTFNHDKIISFQGLTAPKTLSCHNDFPAFRHRGNMPDLGLSVMPYSN